MKIRKNILCLGVLLLMSYSITLAQEAKQDKLAEKIEKKSEEKTKELDKMLDLTDSQFQDVKKYYKEYYIKKEEIDDRIKILEKEQDKLKQSRGTKIASILNENQKKILIEEKEKKKSKKKKD
ncbi:MAG: hypothetical protein KDD29_02420 [Flavobacteriales bacterium]|nr:hypothetical protein [Flavobacteriales bacterium]MCB9335649.1 hypothetical protein [Flavobacteriales bacterium]